MLFHPFIHLIFNVPIPKKFFLLSNLNLFFYILSLFLLILGSDGHHLTTFCAFTGLKTIEFLLPLFFFSQLNNAHSLNLESLILPTEKLRIPLPPEAL